MSYMLGRQYVWVDATQIHIWSAEGYDGWDESSWAQGFEGPTDRRSAAFRMAELVATGEFSAAMDRALANHGGNSGCQALVEHAPSLRAALSQLAPKPGAA